MKIIRNYFFSAMPKYLPKSAKSFIFDQSQNRLYAAQSHPTNISKKKPKPLKSSNNEDWYLKLINDANSSDSLEASLALAEMEVFAQEYRRLICPTHLFNGKNIYTKYRVAFDENNPDNVYVSSKMMNLMGYFSFNTSGEISFGKPYKHITANIQDIPGLGCSSFLAKFLGDIDFKIGNAVIINDAPNQLYFSQIDSGCCFAGTANPDFGSKIYAFQDLNEADFALLQSIIKKEVPSNDKIKNLYEEILSVDKESYQDLFLGKKEVDYLKRIIMKSGANSLARKIFVGKDWDPGKLTAEEILLNPATNLKIYNYLEAIKEETRYNNFTPLLAGASQEPRVKEETMITALRSAMLPDFFEETLMSHYFSKSAYSEKTKLDIKEHMQKQKDILFAVLTAEPACREFFLNDRAIQQGLLRQELERMFNSLNDFTAYAKVKPSEEIADFQEKFVHNVRPLISQMINHPSMNLAKRQSFLDEARRASSQHSSFNTLFLETLASIMERTIEDHIIQTKSNPLTQRYSTKLTEKRDKTLRSEMPRLETKDSLRDLKQTLEGTIAEKTVTLPPPPISSSSVREERSKKSLISLAKEVMEKRARAILNSIPVGRRKKGSDTERLIK